MLTIGWYLCFSSTSRWAGPGEGRITLVTRGEVHQKNTRPTKRKWKGQQYHIHPPQSTFSCLWMSVSSTFHLVKSQGQRFARFSSHQLFVNQKIEKSRSGSPTHSKEIFCDPVLKIYKGVTWSQRPLGPLQAQTPEWIFLGSSDIDKDAKDTLSM